MDEKSLCTEAIGCDPTFDVKSEQVRIRDIRIESSANNNYIVKIGCQWFTFFDALELLIYLQDYLIDPKGTEEKFNSGKLFKK